MIKKLFYIFGSLAVLLLAAGGGAFLWLVVLNPGPELDQANIEKILAMESPVYYADGRSKIGVFFQDAHRQYIPYEDIPHDFINALVAAEDNDFFSHYGIDLLGIGRAMLANIRAGRVIQGGSTITQQTAKNLFKRRSRSVAAKLRELLLSLRLEYHYSKEKIMEFYANQFFVSGNGHGLGVATSYYFDKPVSELTLLECAFIAGSVKRPNFYNPFTKKNEARADQARTRAKQRAAYVLGRMHKLRMIDSDRYQELIKQEIPFKKGNMFYALNTLMDLVKEGLDTPEVEEALTSHGIDNVATSGIRIVTTIEKELQEKTLYGLRKELSRLDVRLRGYDREKLQKAYTDPTYRGDRQIAPGAFLFGNITGIDRSEKVLVHLSFGKNGQTGRIDQAGLMPMLTALVRWQEHRWSTADSGDLPEILDQLRVGDRVFVSVRSQDPVSGELLVDLEKYPLLQGAALLLKDGTIRAMAGGVENNYFNRAVSARRPMGSVIKPLVYGAALQLGWSTIDPLDNGRDVFVYQNSPYFPRPDHESDQPLVSMNWAGVHSENLATVWLLYHLCDQLSPARFKELTGHLGLERAADETYNHYMKKIRDEFGIVVDQDALYRAAFQVATSELEADLVFTGNLNEYKNLQRLHYGIGFDAFLEDVNGILELESVSEQELSLRSDLALKKEVERRREILRNNFLHFLQLRAELQEMRTGPELTADKERMGQLYRSQQTGDYLYAANPPPASDWQVIDRATLLQLLPQDKEIQKKFFQAIRIEDKLSVATVDLLERTIDKEYQRLSSLPPYSPEVLHTIRDFRILAGLHYLTSLGRTLGIKSILEPVLSFPLGSNVITLLEAAVTYEALLRGETTTSGNGSNNEELAIIARIEDGDGQLIYETKRFTKKVFDPKTSLAVSNILRNVVKFGTGRLADRQVRIESRNPETAEQLKQLDLRVPVMGKTGTANRFINSAFVGYVPDVNPESNGLTTASGYTVAAYIGFDDNTPMTKGSSHITGASGALPVWIHLANTILLEKEYGAALDLIDIAFSAAATSEYPALRLLTPELSQIRVAVDINSGLPLTDPAAQTEKKQPPDIVTFGKILPNGEVAADRYFKPYWQVQE